MSDNRPLPSLKAWYASTVRPILESLQPDRATEFDTELQRIERASLAMKGDFAVCLLGNSGVGKSTLLNVMVAGNEAIVPAGGIGPLTALALTVRKADSPHFEVQYHSPGMLSRTVFGLEQTLKKELRGRAAELPSSAIQDSLLIEEEEAKEITEETTTDEDAAARAREYQKLAQLLVKGNQDNHADLPYLVDSLREVLGRKRIWGTKPDPDDQGRIRRLAEALTNTDAIHLFRLESSESPAAFRAALHEHASGFLAPIIRELTIFWDHPLLDHGVVLVDLPGVGIAGDVYRATTRKWIRERADAVVLVVDHRGVTESVAELLRTSEFLNRLLYSADEPEGDPILVVAVAKVDEIAEERRSQDKSLTKRQHFANVCAEARIRIKEQVRTEVESVWASQGAKGEGKLGGEKQRVVENIIERLEVHPISAIQYRRLIAKDEDDPAFLNELSESNIPALVDSLGRISHMRRELITSRFAERCDAFVSHVKAILGALRAQWQDEGRAEAESQRLETELADFTSPLRDEFNVRKGQYRAFLKREIPQRINDLVTNARQTARDEITAYLRSLRDAHWGTLRASVRRGGTFYGARQINLPHDFALRFEEPIAEVWGKLILKDIRKNTREFGNDCVALVEQVVTWSRQQGARVQPALVEAQRDAIKADAKKLDAVGRDAVAELRDEVKNRLITKIEEPIRRKCKAFVERGDDIGPGVKHRILELFDELARDVTQASAEPAAKILQELFGEVERDIREALKQYEDPLRNAVEAIVSSETSRLKRSDAQRRKTVLAALAEAFKLPADLIIDNPRNAVTSERDIRELREHP